MKTCSECGYPATPNEYHPYEYCVLAKAGLDPKEIVKRMNRPLRQALEAFVEAWAKSHQLEKTDVALRMAKQALATSPPNGQ